MRQSMIKPIVCEPYLRKNYCQASFIDLMYEMVRLCRCYEERGACLIDVEDVTRWYYMETNDWVGPIFAGIFTCFRNNDYVQRISLPVLATFEHLSLQKNIPSDAQTSSYQGILLNYLKMQKILWPGHREENAGHDYDSFTDLMHLDGGGVKALMRGGFKAAHAKLWNLLRSDNQVSYVEAMDVLADLDKLHRKHDRITPFTSTVHNRNVQVTVIRNDSSGHKTTVYDMTRCTAGQNDRQDMMQAIRERGRPALIADMKIKTLFPMKQVNNRN